MRKAIIQITLVLMTAALLAGCSSTSPGNIITEEKNFTNFTRVDVEGAFDVEIARSDSFSIVINADDSLSDYVTVSKVGETLRISLTPHHIFTDFTLGAKTLEAKITMPALYGLNLSGASKGTITGFKSSEDLNLVVSGASSLDIENIEVDDAEFEVSGASGVSGNMTASDADFEISGASSVELSGSADDIDLSVSGASKVDLTGFHINNASADISGASEATLNLKGRLDIVLSGASRLYFYGNPTMGNVKVTGTSTIKHK